MKSLDDIANEASLADVRLRVNQPGLARAALMSGDELFQTPLIALTILIVNRELRTGILTNDVGTWTLSTLLRHAQVDRGVRDRIQWSVSLRRRCADALVFLESVGLIRVQERSERTVFITDEGHQFVRELLNRADEAGVLARGLERACSAIRQGGPTLL